MINSSSSFLNWSIVAFWASLVALMVKNLPTIPKTWVRSLDQEDPLEKRIAIHSSILPGEFHRQRSLVGYSSCDPKELDIIEPLTLSLTFMNSLLLITVFLQKYHLCFMCLYIYFDGA